MRPYRGAVNTSDAVPKQARRIGTRRRVASSFERPRSPKIGQMVQSRSQRLWEWRGSAPLSAVGKEIEMGNRLDFDQRSRGH